jgi:hypothetical protein
MENGKITIPGYLGKQLARSPSQTTARHTGTHLSSQAIQEAEIQTKKQDPISKNY